jgi:hypothetical protein
MTCERVGSAIMCGRGRPRRPRAPRQDCRWPGCERGATQAGYVCRSHWFRLSPDLRARLWSAHEAEIRVNGRLGQAWAAVADEAQRWLEEHIARPKADRRQPELPL